MNKNFLFLSLLDSFFIHCSYHQPRPHSADHRHHYGAQGTHSREHSRGHEEIVRPPTPGPERLSIHVYTDEVGNVILIPTPPPFSPSASSTQQMPEVSVSMPSIISPVNQPPTPMSDRTKVKLALIGLGSSITTAVITAIIVWKSSCGDK